MIKLEHLNKTYESGGGTSVKAIDDLSLEIAEGSFTVVIGNNGSGKSTLINLICGTEYPDQGAILLNGKQVQKKEDFERAPWIGRMFQNPAMGTSGDLSILENLRLAALANKRRGLVIGTGSAFRAEVKAQLNRLQMGLDSQMDQPVKHLSGGQRQAISLIMALIHQPQVLLLDEPTAALDPQSASRILSLANEFIQERRISALLITHNMKEACLYGDRLIQLEKGKVKRDISGHDKKNLSPIDLLMWFQNSTLG